MSLARRALLAALVSISASGCSTLGRTGLEKMNAYAANQPDLKKEDVSEYVKQQNANVVSLSMLVTGQSNWTPTVANGTSDWSPLVQAGVNYVDVRCERYLDALFWFNRVREASSRQINYTGAAAGAALAILEASKTLIGLTPLAFTLADQTVNNIGKGLLFDLAPTTVKLLVVKEQTAFKESVGKVSYTTRIAAIQAIQAYANICLPTSIETQATNAINRADFKRVEILVTEKPAALGVTKFGPGTTTEGSVKGDVADPVIDGAVEAGTTITTTTTTKATDGTVTVSAVKQVADIAPPPANSVPVIEQVQGNTPSIPK